MLKTMMRIHQPTLILTLLVWTVLIYSSPLHAHEEPGKESDQSKLGRAATPNTSFAANNTLGMTGFAPLSLPAQSAHTNSRFSFIVIADTQRGATPGGPGIDALTPQIFSDAANRNPLFTVFPGDLVASGSIATWNQWLIDTAAFGDNRYMVPGNHDLHPVRSGTMKQWQQVFSTGLPWVDALAMKNQVGPLVVGLDGSDHDDPDRRGVDYYVDHGNTRIVCLATDGKNGTEWNWNPPSNLEWFRSLMTNAATVAMTNVIVFTHKPLTFEGSEKNADSGGTAWTWWRAISGQDRVGGRAADALFAGHYHLYRPGRPDAGKVNTMEIVVGTGGGRLGGRAQHRHHGYLEVFVDGDRITGRFWGDSNGATGGWSYTEVLDTFVIDPGTGNSYDGQLCRYDFEGSTGLEDHSLDIISKVIPLKLLDGATVVTDGDVARGKVLVTGADKRATTSHIKDHNLALLGDLTLSLYAKADSAVLTGSEGDNVLLAYGAGPPNNSTGSRPGSEINNERHEAENYCYILSVNPDGTLRIAWQYRVYQTDAERPTRDRGDAPDPNRLQWEVVTSTAPVTNLDQWNRIQAVRNSSSKEVTFLVNGLQLGITVSYTNHPTGGQIGSLFIGSSDRSFAGADPGVAEWPGRIDDIQVFNNISGTAGQMLGDFNLDSRVDEVDFSIIRKHLGTKFDTHGNMKTFSKGDVDFDGDVDDHDLKRFKEVFNL